MGILNVTPDSFSDGGVFLSVEAALAHAIKMHEEGAAIIDIGGQSTRPGARPLEVAEELDRVIPVIEAVRAALPTTPISIDTSKPQVMRAAFAAGATLINDVYALRVEGAMEVARDLGVPVCLMHIQGDPLTMQIAPYYDDIVHEVQSFLLERVRRCEQCGISRQNLIIDPGFGFGKTLEHNLTLLARLECFVETGLPVLVGLSRKSMLGSILSKPVGERLFGSVAAAVVAALKGAAILRVHDVAPTLDGVKVVQALMQISRKGNR
jgi:dihydropteroate synthase